MKNYFLLKQMVICLVCIILNVLLQSNASAGVINPMLKAKIDSVYRDFSLGKTEKHKFYALSNFFWKHAFTDYEQVRPLGEKAYEVIKNSKNYRTLSDGYDIKGFIFEHDNQFDSAYYFFDLALKTATPINYKFRICWSHLHFGRIDYLLGDYPSALKNMKKAEKLISEKFDSITIFTDFANIYEQLGKYDSAFIYYNKKLKIFTKANEVQKQLEVYLEIVGFYKRINNIQRALAYLNLGLKLAESSKDSKALIRFYEGIGDFFFIQKKNYDIALEYYYKALENCGEYDDMLKPGIYNQISQIYLAENKDNMAYLYNLRSLKIAERLKLRNETAHAYENLGFIYKKFGKPQLALSNFEAYFSTGCLLCNRLCRNAGRYNEIADLYLKLNKPSEALYYYSKSLELAQKFHAKKEMAISYLKFGNYFHANNPQLAEQRYLVAIEFAKDARNAELIKTIADTLSNFYFKCKKYKDAYTYQSLAIVMGDSLSKMDKLTNTADLELKFEFEKLVKNNETQQVLAAGEIKRQKIYRNSLLLITLLFATLGTVILRTYNRKKKDNLLLTVQKDEIEAQKNEIERISIKLHEADQAKLRFFTNISHEFRTPLTLILEPVNRMIKDADNPQLLKLLQIVQRNSFQLFNLINQLLDMRKLDTGNARLKVVNGNLAYYLKNIYAVFIHRAEENNIAFTFNADNSELSGFFDADIIEKVMNNLLSNAFKFTSNGGEINISLFPIVNLSASEVSYVKIIVTDNGKGIPENQLEYLFDRYFQVENYNSGFNVGTGIGLAYTKELVELHKGEIEVRSSESQGTTFTVTLPVHKSFYSEKEITNDAYMDVNSKKVSGCQNYCISSDFQRSILEEPAMNIETPDRILLIVEDNPDLRTFIKSIFINDYSVLEAGDGLTGYQLATKHIPDIIISDVLMPEMDGLELCTRLKDNIQTNHIPVLMLTARSGEEHEMAGLQTGANDYLTKPFKTEILEARVYNLMQSKLKLQEYFTRQFILNPKEIQLASPADEFLKKAVQIVEENITRDDLNVELLMKELGVSRAQLFRKIKAVTNYSVNEFIRTIRLKRAEQLLIQKSFNISEIIYLCGFNSPSYFTACFKEMYGCLPKDYAQRNLEKVE